MRGEVGKVLAQPFSSKSGISFLTCEYPRPVCFQNTDHLKRIRGHITSLVDNCELLATTAGREAMYQLLVFLPPPRCLFRCEVFQIRVKGIQLFHCVCSLARFMM